MFVFCLVVKKSGGVKMSRFIGKDMKEHVQVDPEGHVVESPVFRKKTLWTDFHFNKEIGFMKHHLLIYKTCI